MPSKKYKVSSQLVEIDPRAVEVPSWARKIAREYLEESVESRGVIVPIVVGRLKQGSQTRFILIDGHGRLQIALSQGIELIPARIFDIKDEREALLISIELEKTREEWSLDYTLNVIQELINSGYKKTEISKILKVPRNRIYRLLWIAEFPEHLQEYFKDGTFPIRLADELHSIIEEVGEETFMKKFLWYLEDFEPTKAIRATIDSLKKIKMSEPEIEEVLEEEEEKITPEAETVPAGTEQKLIPASEIEVPEEVEEVEVVEEEEEEEVKRIPTKTITAYNKINHALLAIKDAINDLEDAWPLVVEKKEIHDQIGPIVVTLHDIEDKLEKMKEKLGEDLE
ncbi:MAG: hypothetical protein DRG59_03640 [Deltaproteobacteria bacterium]|nr:MAG: hypothetical protein DRG59_03640 [Deltaproteobacteria bacterium]